MHFVQPPLLKPTGDGPTSHPELDQLRPTDYAVLPPSQPLHFPLKNFSGQLSTYTVPNRPLVFHASEGERFGRADGAQNVPILGRLYAFSGTAQVVS